MIRPWFGLRATESSARNERFVAFWPPRRHLTRKANVAPGRPSERNHTTPRNRATQRGHATQRVASLGYAARDEDHGLSARQIMTADEMRRALTRIGHEIVEKHGGTEGLALVGIERRGPILASRIAEVIAAKCGTRLPVAAVETVRFRDDRPGAIDPDATSAILERQPFPFELPQSTVVLIDDVLFTGRTVRAAMDALVDRGRPAAVRLAVLIDRGHRELPIRADHVGKNVPTARDELIEVVLEESDSMTDAVRLIGPGD